MLACFIKERIATSITPATNVRCFGMNRETPFDVLKMELFIMILSDVSEDIIRIRLCIYFCQIFHGFRVRCKNLTTIEKDRRDQSGEQIVSSFVRQTVFYDAAFQAIECS